ncbi:MAG: phosphatidylserine decarboxylase [Candidatus Helarchaeota archaeon]
MGLKIVLTVGCFDLFHEGHKNLFRYMANYGDEIIVGLHDQSSTLVNKGIHLLDPLAVRRKHVLSQPKVKRTFVIRQPDPSDDLRRIIKELRAKGHKLIYIRGNDWVDFPGRDLLEQEGIPILLMNYTEGISSTQLRNQVLELVQKVYEALIDDTISDEEIIPLLEEALFMPSDAVMREVYKKLYDGKHHQVFGERFLRLSRIIGKMWDRPESKKLIPRFIERMDVNIAELEKKPSEFPSLNAFFARSIDLSKRPFEKGGPNPLNIYSPSDGLVLVYSNVKQAKDRFIKGKNFSLSRLLDNNDEFISIVKDGAMVIIRLQPKDVHRMYAPLSGVVGVFQWAGTRLHTVKSTIVARPDVDVFTENIRVIIPFHDTPVGSFLLIAIGAPLIGSIVLHPKPGEKVELGQEIGYFQYGGSTIVLLFPPKPPIEWRFPIDKDYEAEAPIWIHQTLGRIIKQN